MAHAGPYIKTRGVAPRKKPRNPSQRQSAVAVDQAAVADGERWRVGAAASAAASTPTQALRLQPRLPIERRRERGGEGAAEAAEQEGGERYSPLGLTTFRASFAIIINEAYGTFIAKVVGSERYSGRRPSPACGSGNGRRCGSSPAACVA